MATTSGGRPAAPACSQAPMGVSCCCCKLCDMGGCDVRVMGCGCCLHARCCPVSDHTKLTACPVCSQPITALQLMPMNFEEIDHARAQATLTALSDKRGKKRKNATIARLTASHHPSLGTMGGGAAVPGVDGNEVNSHGGAVSASAGSTDASDLRTGRWTKEETEYCDRLILLFEEGKLPIPDNLKLNEFLANMLKSKQSRLTKKMKNARLSSKQYKRALGHVQEKAQARAFSRLETEFFASIKCPMERSEIRFHMQKEWRELFSSFCVAIGQALDANAWLYSVEELERRASKQRDAARMARRKVMMGQALTNDSTNSMQRGVHIAAASTTIEDVHATAQAVATAGGSTQGVAALAAQTSVPSRANTFVKQREMLHELAKHDRNPMKHYASPFIERVLHIVRRYKVPFEHLDAWVPSFVESGNAAQAGDQQNNCRLCFAGCGTVEDIVTSLDKNAPTTPLCSDTKFNFRCFGEYSQKFSFDVGCGLPGRVYSTGVASWEQGIQNAPLAQFERCGGASQWGIQTVLGIPISSPTVGRVVILFYSTLDRPRNLNLVNLLSDELAKLKPAPKWKLVVDIGVGPPPMAANASEEQQRLHRELLALMEKCTPTDKTSPLASYLPGFTSLRLLLSNKSRSPSDDEMITSVLACYASYKDVGRSEADMASMTARDFMLISKQTAAAMAKKATTNALVSAGTAVSQQQHMQQHPSQSTAEQSVVVPSNPSSRMATTTKPGNQVSIAAAVSNSSIENPTIVQAIDTQLVAHELNPKQDINNVMEHPYQNFLMENPLNASGHAEPIPSLGPSPALQPISSQVDAVSGLAPLGLTACQITALLQNDATMTEF